MFTASNIYLPHEFTKKLRTIVNSRPNRRFSPYTNAWRNCLFHMVSGCGTLYGAREALTGPLRDYTLWCLEHAGQSALKAVSQLRIVSEIFVRFQCDASHNSLNNSLAKTEPKTPYSSSSLQVWWGCASRHLTYMLQCYHPVTLKQGRMWQMSHCKLPKMRRYNGIFEFFHA